MPKINFTPHRFRKGPLATIRRANGVLAEYAEDGFVLTLRQLYYQFVARAWIPNTIKSYKRLGGILGRARLAGLVDWDHLEDRTRNLQQVLKYASVDEALQAMAGWYSVDLWAGQEVRPEVWIEKDAMLGVVQGVCDELDVPYFSCRGYSSLSEMYRAAQRLIQHSRDGHRPVVLHLGDHDPSGMDMTRDIIHRVKRVFGAPLEVKRIALNMDQIRELKPPPNPVKVKDTRHKAYVAKFGASSWELDALPPRYIVNLIRSEVAELIDDLDARVLAVQERDKVREELRVTKWAEVAAGRKAIKNLAKAREELADEEAARRIAEAEVRRVRAALQIEVAKNQAKTNTKKKRGGRD